MNMIDLSLTQLLPVEPVEIDLSALLIRSTHNKNPSLKKNNDKLTCTPFFFCFWNFFFVSFTKDYHVVHTSLKPTLLQQLHTDILPKMQLVKYVLVCPIREE